MALALDKICEEVVKEFLLSALLKKPLKIMA
jgi:hypothetical protein